MKILLYVENEKAIKKSGIGKAYAHQQRALSLNDIEYTTDHHCKDYDIIHINTTFFNSYRMAKKAKRMHKKIVYHAHSTEEDFKNSFMFSNLLAPLYKKWLIHLYNMGDVIITPTPYSKSLLEGYGIKKRIYAVSNGIDIDQFYGSPERETAFRQYFHLKENDKTVISVGWLFERKGFDTFCEVASYFPDVKFIWFGDKNLSAPTKKIRKLYTHHPDNVILPGYVSGDVIKGAYAHADLFFFPSREETEGIVVLEALASKINVLVRDIPVYHGWLCHEKNCYMAKTNQAFVDYIRKILNGDLPSLIEEGYQTAKEREIKQIGNMLKEVYLQALKGE